MSYSKQIESSRKEREDFINNIKQDFNEDNEQFQYFPINEQWKVPAVLTFRTPKDGIIDYKTLFQKRGKAELKIGTNSYTFTLYSLNEHYYICFKDLTSDKTSYPVGRFIPILEQNNEYFADCNLAYAPVCGHLVTLVPCPAIRETIAVEVNAGEKYEKHD